jgi:hydroxyethylthiazole kinase
MSYLKRVRERNPLVHNITNLVVANFTANGLLALGASPFMAYAHEEVEDVARIADAVMFNIGTLDENVVQSILLAGRSANANGVPVVFDPVGAGATPYRTETAQTVMKQVKVDVLRGNMAEIANTAGERWDIKGVDAGEGSGDALEIARRAALKLGCIVAATGKEDIVTDGTAVALIGNGHPLLAKVTGAGCLLSSVVAAFLAVGGESKLDAVTEALAFYGIAAENAFERTAGQGPGSFQIEFINQLASVSPETVNERKIVRPWKQST